MTVTNTPASLARVGVTRLNRDPLELQCQYCNTIWRPVLDRKGHLPDGWWKCPKNQSHTIDWDTVAVKSMGSSRIPGTKQLKK